MLKVTENECVNCGLPCLGDKCRYRNVVHCYCDDCHSEEKLYYFDGRELCLCCIERLLEKVEV